MTDPHQSPQPNCAAPSDDELVRLKKSMRISLTPWGDTLQFARAVIALRDEQLGRELALAKAEQARLAAEVAALQKQTVVIIDGHQIRPAEVLKRIIHGARPKRGHPLWSHISELTAHGSTVSAGLCKWAGVDAYSDKGRGAS